ncbi:MAG: hypothetical protein HFJ94_00475 [Muribaculaceae bacterium]|nr:hypothetical protein [Muribaculaceae bacterium]
MKRFFKYIPIALLATLLGACTDQKLWDDDEVIGEGEAKISGSFSFKSYGSALDSRTAGDAIDKLNSVTVLAYSEDGKQLIKRRVFSVADGSLTVDYTNTSAPNNATNPESEKTGRGTFKLDLEYGKYKIYAVGNADLAAYTDDDLADDSKLKAISFTWQTDVAKDNQMFGWFSNKLASSIAADQNFDAEVVTINRPSVNLSAWLVRLASKVTVAFDASGLYDNVFVYLKSVQIKDIPKTCYLGQPNTPTESEVNPNGEIYYYYDREKYPGGPSVNDFNINSYDASLTNGKPTYGSDHTHGADALFFYENNQGKGKDKAQDANGDGKIDFPNGDSGKLEDGYKDKELAGSYIEVKAYYISRNTGRAGQGEITYRFMLGKDITTSYEALRNYHFKLTLILKGYANEADWHIVYDQEEHKIIAPNPYYISYLYNHSMMLPLTIKTGSLTIKKIEADIVSNNWAPLNASYGLGGSIITSSNEANYYNSYYLYWTGVDNPTAYPWNGFLSLRKTQDTNIDGKFPVDVNSNKDYYLNTHRNEVVYEDFSPTPESTSVSEALADGTIHVALNKDDNGHNTYVVNMPLWTRAKTLISLTGYTGNNPYVAYRRQAKVKVTVTLSDGTTMNTEDDNYYQSGENIEIQQVRRVVNPKGIWRAGNEKSDFDVDLRVLPDEESTKFMSLTSDGPWRAYVFRDTKRGTGNATGWDDANGVIQLVGTAETTTGTTKVRDRDNIEREYQTIEGKTGSKMQFKVKFNGTTSDDNPNYAIIRVEYQNYSCYHLIFVRQGYGADAIVDGGAKWMTSNNVAQSEVAPSPLDEGSLFKYANWGQPIAASNNKNSKSPWTEVTPNDFIKNASGSNPLTLATGGSEIWANITHTPIPQKNKTDVHFPAQTGMRVATEADFNALKNNTDIEQGYGVLYGGSSTSCLTSIDDVYCYDATHTNRGMRGCFVYNYKTGKNLFFPIGASGYGHRKDEQEVEQDGATTVYRGVLRYAASPRWGYFSSVNSGSYKDGVSSGPLFFDLFRRPGACYWLDYPQTHSDTYNYPSWDINYFSFDFGSIPADNVKLGKDAIFVRSISTK